ncbi:cilia- and flagella-associated protein 57 [Caerostris darwini]|uniref:Cilia- and flagella-associated protein 57 n=1 Tax=Caerostris darwini TaxID=1538125 RepID=A0AAV4R4X2_9ARAC|nr:cilia- and flagella-associated protein 57 [Caerostris darwini]
MDSEFYYSFGVNSSCIRNMTFYDNNTIIFIAGKLCVLLDLRTRNQRLIQIVEGYELTALIRCESHLVLALKGNPPIVCLYNIDSSSKKLYPGPPSMKSDTFHCISVSVSLKFVAAQSYGPDWVLVIWLSGTKEIVAVFKPNAGKPRCAVHDMSFNASDREELIVVGKNVFRLYEYQNESESEAGEFVEVIFEKHEEGEEYLSIAWPQKENLAVSNTNGKILFFRGIDLVREISVMDTLQDILDSTQDSSATDISLQLRAVTCLTCTPHKLLCVFDGCTVVIYEGEEIFQYTLSKCVYLSTPNVVNKFPGEAVMSYDFLTQMEWNLNFTILSATTADGQLLYLDFSKKDTDVKHFDILLYRQLTNPVIAMDFARDRPVVGTCSEKSLILWNYETRRQELIMKFRNTLKSFAIHPSGLYLALGFDFFARICAVLYDRLADYTMLDLKNCSRISFSYGGNLLALASNTTIEIYDFLTFKRLSKLDSHAGRILSLLWTNDDSRLFSGDERGVICEWDLVSWCKLWENTAVVLYSCVAFMPNKNAIVAVAGRSLKCVSDGSVQWEFDCPNNLNAIAITNDGKFVYTGAVAGNIGKYSLPISGTLISMFAHNGEVTEMKFNSSNRILFTASKDGLLFVWKTELLDEDVKEGTLGNAVFTSTSDLSEQKEKIKILRLSVKQCAVAYECDVKFYQLEHEEVMRDMFVDHERVISQLNKEIGDTKTEIELAVFDSDISGELQAVEEFSRRKMFEQTEKLDAAYKRTKEYIEETQKMTEMFDNTLSVMEKDYTEIMTREVENEQILLNRVRDLENTIMRVQETTQAERETILVAKQKFEDKKLAEGKVWREAEEVKIEKEKRELEMLENESKRLHCLAMLMQEDAERKRKLASGHVDYEIYEKLNGVDVLRKQYHSLEDKLKAKERIAQTQDAKYYKMRKVVGSLHRSHSVFKGTVERMKSKIRAIQTEIESCRKEITESNDAVPIIEEKIRLSSDQCNTLIKKLRETIDGFRDKRDVLRGHQNILLKYTSLLHESLSFNCKPKELRQNILHLFDQVKSGVEEYLDPNLKNEFAHQVETLKDTYQYIKGDPSKLTKEQSSAEFKLSQENSKLLNEVHVVQKEQEKLREVIFQMEVAMGMPQTRLAKPTKKTAELRDTIDFVFSTLSRTREEKANELKNLDKLIEEQQDEMHRLQLKLENK